MSNYKKIIIAIDFDSEYENVIHRALKIAESKEDLILLFVTLPSVYIQPYMYGMETKEFNDEYRTKKAMKRMQEIAKKFGISSHNVYIKLGHVADEIKQFANETHADLIAIGTHGRSGIKLLLGSTANAVLHGVKQDVLAVRMHDNAHA
jgi:universal stress protein A